jgi:hypothetical protein
MYNLHEKLEWQILINIWTTRDFLMFALQEGCIAEPWAGMLNDHQESSEELLDWLFELRSGYCPNHDDLAWPQEEVFL